MIRVAFSGIHRALDGCMLARAPASPAQGLHPHGPRYFNFPYICMMSIEVALDMEQGCLMNRFDIDWSVPLPVKCRVTCPPVTLRELQQKTSLVTFFYDFVSCAAHQTVFSVACSSDSETIILAALQTVETVVRTQRHRLDAEKFLMFSVGWTWQGFCRDLDPCWFE